ncbi:MAG TPA: fatty acid desaturase [Thermoanaerobaculia bacterium]|nr:fatty acid desaturase [Thermoanaerobaculia bacterium]
MTIAEPTAPPCPEAISTPPPAPAAPANGSPTAAGEGHWRRLLAPYKRASRRRALGQLANSALPFAAIWALAAWSFQVSYLWTLALAVPAAFFFTRLFIVQHDCGHGSFFRSAKANNALGAVLGVVTLFPYGYWRRTHAIHHATSGNLDQREFGDVDTLTVREYRALPRWRRLGYRLYRHPVVLFAVGPFYQFVLKHRFPLDLPWAWKREWKSVLWTNLGIAAAAGVLGALVGWTTFLAVHLTIVLVAGALGVWLFYVQHQFEDTYWEDQEAWDFYRAGAHGSSFYDLPPILHWLTGNIGYHHIHHLSSRIPNYRLRETFEENPELQRVTRLTLRDSLACARLRLWDEDGRRMIGWRELRAIGKSSGPDASVLVERAVDRAGPGGPAQDSRVPQI